MRNTIELIIRLLIHISYCIWCSLYVSYLTYHPNTLCDYFALLGAVMIFLIAIGPVYFKKRFSLSYGEWDNLGFWTALIIATIFNIIHWDEIVASQPQFLRVYLGNIFAR